MWFRILQCLTLLLVLAGNAAAQAPQPPGPPPGAHLARELGLNASQTTRLTAALDAERAAMDKLRTERQRIHSATREQLAGFLTAEQLRRFDELREMGPPQRQRPSRDAEMKTPERKPS